MAAPTEVYVDPAIAGASGAGTVGDPYGDIQHALDTVTRDGTNGDRFNIKAGTDEILAAALDLSTYGAPGLGSPLLFQGYTTAAGDGGIGGISGNAGVAVYAGADENVYFQEMHLHNCGAATILTLPQRCGAFGCELDNTTGSAVVASAISSVIAGCNIHNIATYGVSGICRVLRCYFKNGTNDFTRAINALTNSSIWGNIFSLDAASVGIYLDNGEWECGNNSLLSSSGTGIGIAVASGGEYNGVLINNLVEGFSGAGGVGVKADGARKLAAYGCNGAYNNTANYSVTQFVATLGTNEALGSSPFAKSGADTFANRATYFEPNDVGNIRAGAYPTVLRLDKGAVQHSDPAGGGGLLVHPGTSGGARG